MCVVFLLKITEVDMFNNSTGVQQVILVTLERCLGFLDGESSTVYQYLAVYIPGT